MANTLETSLDKMDYSEIKTKVDSSTGDKGPKNPEEITKLKDELEKRAGYPKNDEISTVFEGVNVNEKVDMARKLISRVLEEQGVTSVINDKVMNGTKTGINLTQENSTPENPQVFFKQIIKKEENFWGKVKEENSDEVQVVVRLNNGDNPENSTVVICTVKQIKGVPQINDADGLYQITTEKDFTEGTEKSKGSYAKWLRGEVTNDKYLDKYKKENKGEALAEFHRKKDALLGNDQKGWTAETKKGELMTRIEGKYGELLQQAQDEILKIETDVKEKLAEEKKKRDAILISETFKIYKKQMSDIEGLKEDTRNEFKKLFIDMGLSGEVIEENL